MAGRRPTGEESLAVLLLPARLEAFARADHAQGLLSIPRVVALEPAQVRTPGFLRDAAPVRQARRLRFPGRVRLLVLYHPAQYPLARALRTRHEDAELWYLPSPEQGAAGESDPEERSLDALARHHARSVLESPHDDEPEDSPLRERLWELDVISPYAFVPQVSRRFRR